MTPEEVKENMKIATKPVSMDAPLTTDEESISLYDVYIAPDPSIQAPESSLNRLTENRYRTFVRCFVGT